MSYTPQVDDYVKWSDSLGKITEGWVYFKCNESISIEVGVKDKPHCEYTKNEKHKKVHILVVCPSFLWDKLEYVTNRRDEEKTSYDKIPSRY